MSLPSWTKKNFIDTCAFLISITLAIAAYGKWFYPIEILQGWEKGIALVELLIIIFIWSFRTRPLFWLILMLLFASWSGYALFWYTLKLPCSCMGNLLHIPTILTIGLDFLFIFLSGAAAYRCKVTRPHLHIALLLLLPCLAMGFYVGHCIYTYWVSPS